MAVIKSTSRSAPVKLTSALLKRYDKLERERRELQRRLKNIETEQKQAVEAAETFARESLGRKFGPGRSVEAFGFNIVVGTGARRVAWKDEFIALHGQEHADRIQAAVVPPLTISIHKPGADQS